MKNDNIIVVYLSRVGLVFIQRIMKKRHLNFFLNFKDYIMLM